jgi:SAM-dependent methyltransferase
MRVADAGMAAVADGGLGAFPDLAVPPEIRYWNRGLERVPEITGASRVMDCRDLIDACVRLQLTPPLMGRVLDVGCGTGRWQSWCSAYIGLDVSEDAVNYARRAGRIAHLIQGYGPSALDGWLGGCEWVCCFSVFTHIDFEERHDYLEAFHRLAPQMVVDIIPGDGTGDVVKWTADQSQFERDLVDTGWRMQAVAERTSPDGVTHRYYHGVHV